MSRRASLSPRVRGNPRRHQPFLPRVQSIPAFAGEPLPEGVITLGEAVYPRVCGGTCDEIGHGCAYKGLSPRVRGNPRITKVLTGHGRSIPVCAGEPSAPPTATSAPSVYPRVCGEPCTGPARTSPSTVYPRVCRGTGGRGGGYTEGWGLSPRVRGNPGKLRDHHVPGRSIPACAGEPVRCAHCNHWFEVYPRVCGGTLGLLIVPPTIIFAKGIMSTRCPQFTRHAPSVSRISSARFARRQYPHPPPLSGAEMGKIWAIITSPPPTAGAATTQESTPPCPTVPPPPC